MRVTQVNISDSPIMQIPILGEVQPCLQAAAFHYGEKYMAKTVVAVLNICNISTALVS